MLQRLGIAQALVHDPNVVFLDEPMSGLDPIGRKEIRDLILRLRAEGKTVFMNTHILHDVEMVCDRVAIIVKGGSATRGRSRTSSPVPRDRSVGRGDREPAGGAAMRPLEERFGAQLRGMGDRVEARVAEKAVNDALRLALDAGAERSISVSPHRVSLESFFLSAVEDGDAGGRANELADADLDHRE